MLEPRAGVFVGSLSAIVRDMLWEKACRNSKGGGCLLAYSSNNEQGFRLKAWGSTSRGLVDFDGLTLVSVVQSAPDNPLSSPRTWG